MFDAFNTKELLMSKNAYQKKYFYFCLKTSKMQINFKRAAIQ